MARGDNSGLYMLLDAMARRDQLSESRADRSLRKEQMMIALEEIRQRNVVERSKIDLEDAKFKASLEVEKLRLGNEQKKFDLDFKIRQNEFSLQLKQMAIAQQQADDAHRRNELDIEVIKEGRERDRLQAYRQARQDAITDRDALMTRVTDLESKHGEAATALIATFGGKNKDGEFEFNDTYKELYESYRKGAGLTKGTSKEAVASLWADSLALQYKDSADQALKEANAIRKQQGKPLYHSINQLTEVERKAAVENAMSAWLTGNNGIMAKAALGELNETQRSNLMKQYANDPDGMTNVLLSMVRFSGKSISIGNAVPESYNDPSGVGKRHIYSALQNVTMNYVATAGKAVPILYQTSADMASFKSELALLDREAQINEALAKQQESNILLNRGELTPSQEKVIRDGVFLSWEVLGDPDTSVTPEGVKDDGKGVIASGISPFSKDYFSKYMSLKGQQALIIEDATKTIRSRVEERMRSTISAGLQYNPLLTDPNGPPPLVPAAAAVDSAKTAAPQASVAPETNPYSAGSPQWLLWLKHHPQQAAVAADPAVAQNQVLMPHQQLGRLVGGLVEGAVPSAQANEAMVRYQDQMRGLGQ